MDEYQIIILIIIIGLIVISINRLVYHRSLMATIVEYYLKVTSKKYQDSEVIKIIEEKILIKEERYKIPKRFINKVSDSNYKDMQVLVFNKDIKSKKVVIYLHGGAYVRNPRYHHMKFIYKLSKKIDMKVLMPIYPKAPYHNFNKSFDLLTKLYLELRDEYSDIYLMGDSSGGGLALGLCEDFAIKNIIQPNELVLLSPWVDITLDNEDINEYVKKEPLLSVSNTKIWGKFWCGDISLKDYRVSPLFGEVKKLKNVSIFVGTREILYPDNYLLYKLLKKQAVNVEIYVGRGLNHVYPIYPIPEAKKALKQIVDIIK